MFYPPPPPRSVPDDAAERDAGAAKKSEVLKTLSKTVAKLAATNPERAKVLGDRIASGVESMLDLLLSEPSEGFVIKTSETRSSSSTS